MQLKAENIQKIYGKRTVVKDVSFYVEQGEIVGLLGPNGAGKTTSFYMVTGLIQPNQGRVVFRSLSVENNIKAVLELTGLSKKEQAEKLDALLEEFGLTERRKYIGHHLSGGERRRTEIARALATDPKFILLDEPFAGVDPIAVEDIQRIVWKLKERNIGILITDHNVQETLSITDRAYLLYDGNILKSGSAEELASDEQVRRVYLGQNFVLRARKE